MNRKIVRCPRCGFEFIPLRPSEKKILSLLNEKGKLRFSEIKRMTSLSPPSLSEALHFLLQQGLIRRNGKFYETQKDKTINLQI